MEVTLKIMVRENNFLLGYGERLTGNVTVEKTSGPKEPPYDFNIAKAHMTAWLAGASAYFQRLPIDACPGDCVTAVMTMHPRYVSKSDFPQGLMDSVGLKPVGGRTRLVEPRAWGIDKHPQEALTDEILVVGTRAQFTHWLQELPYWNADHKGASHLTHLESFTALRGDDKISQLPNKDELLLEVVLHQPDSAPILQQFERYAHKLEAQPVLDRVRFTKGLVFVPVRARRCVLNSLAEFSMIRVLRAMPTLRPLNPGPLRQSSLFAVKLPEATALDPSIRVAVFDGGLPPSSQVSRWVNAIEPKGIGMPVPEFQVHGVAVTSALLFGPLSAAHEAPRPLCQLDHIRVLDHNTGANGDFEYYDVLDRIVHHLDHSDEPYQYVNISLGPRMPLDDTDITRWTAELDQRCAGGTTLITVAAGNDGDLDGASRLNRIQPPADGVNVLSVGACNRLEPQNWSRANYSCVGPGRCPGVVKPDGVCFGGSEEFPFYVLSSRGGAQASGVQGTSFAAPFALRSAVSVRAQLGEYFSPLAVRALLVHRAERGGHSTLEVGWGRFEDNLARLVTCDDDETLVVFQGELPVKEHLRAPVPLPEGYLDGFVSMTATLTIAPDVDPAYANTYTKGGLEVFFRPDTTRFKKREDGTLPPHAKTVPFFSKSNLHKTGEYILREEGYKWETCLKATRRFRAKTLNEPCLDIYYHNRNAGVPLANPRPISYALVISVRAPKVPDLYDRVVRSYANILVPLQPKIRVQITR